MYIFGCKKNAGNRGLFRILNEKGYIIMYKQIVLKSLIMDKEIKVKIRIYHHFELEVVGDEYSTGLYFIVRNGQEYLGVPPLRIERND